MSLGKILVFGNRLLGDSIDSLAAVQALAKGHERSRLDLLAPSYVHGIYRALGCFDRFIDSRGLVDRSGAGRKFSPWRARLELYRRLKREAYDLAFILPGGWGHAAFAHLLRIPVRVGHRSDARSWLLTHRAPLDRNRPNYQNFNALLSALPRPLVPVPLRLPEKTGKRLPVSNYFAVSPCASEPWRMWPAPHFIDFCRRVRAQRGWTAAFLGMESERDYIERLCGAVGGVNLAGSLTVDDLMPVLREAKFFVGASSGVAHLAAAVGAPKLILFGPSNPTLSMPAGERVRAVYHEVAGIPHRDRPKRRHRVAVALDRVAPDLALSELDRPGFID